MFSGLTMSQKRHLTNGMRNLFNFYQAQGLVGKQYLDVLRDNFPKTSIGVDLNVPTESDVLAALRHLEERDKEKRIFALYNLLVDSGLRLVESIRLFNTLVEDSSRLEQLNGFCIQPLGYFRNTKLAYFGFITSYTLSLIKKCEKPLVYDRTMGTATKRYEVISYKYLRKFVFDTMTSEQLNIPESVADFIEGRTSKSVGARHYMNLKRKAIQFYPRYRDYLISLRSKLNKEQVEEYDDLASWTQNYSSS